MCDNLQRRSLSMKLIPSLLLCTMAFTAPVLANAAESYPSGPINVICT